MIFLSKYLKKISESLSFLKVSDYIFIVLVFFGILGIILSNKVNQRGDSTEYMMTTETIFFDHSLRYTPNILQRHKTLKPSSLDVGGYTVNKGKDGNSYFTQHSVYYPLFTTPLYGLMHYVNAKLAYWSFSIFNLVLFMISILYLIYYFKVILKNELYQYLVFAFLFLSAVFPYIFWPHPETFIFFNIVSFFFFLYVLKKPALSALFLGFAVGQSVVLCFLFLNLIYYLLFLEKPNFKKIIVPFSIFGAISSIPYIVSFIYTGRFFSLVNYSTISLLAMKDIFYAIFDPSVGLIWFYPMVLLSLFFLKREFKNLVILTSVFLSLLFFMVNNQFYTHQIGLRYLNYIYPPFFFIFDIKKIKRNILFIVIFMGFAFLLTAGPNTNLERNSNGMNFEKRDFIAYKFFSKVLFPYYKEHPGEFIYHTTLLNNKIQSSPDILHSFKLFVEDGEGNLFLPDNWIVDGRWVRLLLNPVASGELKIKLKKDCGVTGIILDNKHLAFNTKEIPLGIKKNMIGHTAKRDWDALFSDYLYLDIKFDQVCSLNGIAEIENNGKEVYLDSKKFL